MSDLDANFDNQLAAFMGGEKVEEVKEPETMETVSEEETITEPEKTAESTNFDLSLIHISEPTRPCGTSRMPSSA